jgi:hypothetical protein
MSSDSESNLSSNNDQQGTCDDFKSSKEKNIWTKRIQNEYDQVVYNYDTRKLQDKMYLLHLFKKKIFLLVNFLIIYFSF